MGDQVRFAVIGCGFMGSIHGHNIASSKHADLVCCCDTDAASATRLAQQTNAPHTTTDFQAVISDPKIDAVVIATPTHNHADLAVAAAASGKHILQEKPMATSVEECLAIERAVAGAGVCMIIGFKFRFARAVLAAREAVPEPLMLIGQGIYDAATATSGWLNDRGLSGGRLMSGMVHTVDLLRYLSRSEPLRVYAEGGNLMFENLDEPDNAVATVAFKNGVVGSVVNGTSGQSRWLSTWCTQVVGRRVNATIHDHARRLQLHRPDEPPATPELFEDIENSHAVGTRPLLAEFLAAIRENRPPCPSPRDGTMSVLICRAIEQSMKTATPQSIVIPD